MRLPAIAGIALAALLTACAGSEGRGSPSDDLSTTETSLFRSHSTIPLPVSTEPGDILYASSIWGIEIVEVLADGQAITGNASLIMLDDPNIEPLTVQSGTFIYNVNPSYMIFGKLSLPLDYDLVEYEIPEDTEVLEIRYRLVPYGNEPEPRVYTLRAFRGG